MEHHPDRGGTKEKFQEIQLAWSQIEAGYVFVQPSKSTQSSFNDAPKPHPAYQKEYTYAKPVLPRAKSIGRGRYAVSLTITDYQSFQGCNIPFICGGSVVEHWVSPGSEPYTTKCLFNTNPMIGAFTEVLEVEVTLNIIPDTKKESEPEKKSPKTIKRVVQIFALSLFSGGEIKIPVSGKYVTAIIEPGYNPDKPLVLFGQGENGGDLILRIKPIFKSPAEFDSLEIREVKRLNEIINE